MRGSGVARGSRTHTVTLEESYAAVEHQCDEIGGPREGRTLRNLRAEQAHYRQCLRPEVINLSNFSDQSSLDVF